MKCHDRIWKRFIAVHAIASSGMMCLSLAAVAECPTEPVPQPDSVVEVLVTDANTNGSDSAIGMDCSGRFVVGWVSKPPGIGQPNDIWVLRYHNDGTLFCNAGAGDQCPASLINQSAPAAGGSATVALSPGGLVRVGWTADRTAAGTNGIYHLESDFAFGLSPFTPPKRLTPNEGHSPSHIDPSVAVSDGAAHAVAWSNLSGGGGDVGMFLDLDIVAGTSDEYVDSTVNPSGFGRRFRPCVAMNSENTAILCWSHPEAPQLLTPFNVKMEAFGTSGQLLYAFAPVNQPDLEPFNTFQDSPSVAYDDFGNIVTVWIGPTVEDCNTNKPFRVYASYCQMSLIAS